MISATLDTSFGAAFAIAKDGNIIFDGFLDSNGRESDRLLAPWLLEVLQKLHLELQDISCWTVGTGPGSFAGLRCGIAMIKGFCLSTRAQLRGVPTAIAVAALAETRGTVGVLNDGRCGQLILTRVANGQMLENPVALNPEELVSPAYACEKYATVQIDRLPELPPAIANKIFSATQCSAVPLLQAESKKYFWPQNQQEIDESTEPLYVRPPVFVQPSPIRVVE